jgi:diguanylate cyclase (GGDEF)-like protein
MPPAAGLAQGHHPQGDRRPWAVALAALGLATVVVWSGAGGSDVSTAVADLAAIVAALGGGVIVLREARRSTRDRGPWRLLGVALLLWGLGELLWGWYELVRGDEVPFPSIADVAYLGAVPFAVVGLLGFAHSGGTRFHVRAVLDGCLVSSALLFVAWALVLGPAWRTDADGLLVHVISVSYPATDLVLAVLALVVVQWGNATDRTSLRMVAAGLLVMAVADTAFTWLTTNGSYSSSNPVAMLWPLSYGMLAYATQLRPTVGWHGDDVPEESEGALLVPYFPLLAAIAVGAPRVLGGHPLGPFLTANGAVVLVLLLLRQAPTAWDLRPSVRALHEREAELRRLAMEDPLTGLANRASFAARLESALALPHVEPAVIYIDLDGFKQVNDHFGHAIGDLLLVEVSGRLQSCMAPSMLLARLGGDEFVVLVEDGHDEALEVAHQILAAFAVPFHSSGELIPFRASLGIAAAPAGGSPDEALRRADAAMYVAKTNGKGRAVDYPDVDLVDRRR